MKKLFLMMLTVAMATCFVACKSDAAKPADGEKAATEKVEEKAALPTVTLEDMQELVKKAKAEGKDWSIDQWKDATRTIMIGMKPMFDAMLDFQKKTDDPEFKKKLEENPAEATALMTDLQKALEQYKPMETVMNDFEAAVDASPVAKGIEKDTVWFNQLVKELDLPAEIFD